MATSGTIKKKEYDNGLDKIYLIVDWERIGISIDDNAVHGSDSDKNAAKEIAFFFSGLELL